MSVTAERQGQYVHAELRGEHEKWLVRSYSARRSSAESHAHEEVELSHEEVGRVIAEFVLGGYDRVSAFLEDTILIAAERGKVLAVDVLTAITHRAEVSDEELAAILRLAVDGDDSNGLYSVAEAAIAGWPEEVRPIP